MVKLTKAKTFQAYLDSCHRRYSCVHCRAHLANHDDLISKVCVLQSFVVVVVNYFSWLIHRFTSLLSQRSERSETGKTALTQNFRLISQVTTLWKMFHKAEKIISGCVSDTNVKLTCPLILFCLLVVPRQSGQSIPLQLCVSIAT